MANQLTTYAEQYLWNNYKRYLMQYRTCLCDNILKIKDETAELPINRYDDFMNALNEHTSLDSYLIQQATMFNTLPYVVMNIELVDNDAGCSCEAVVGFTTVFATDTPQNLTATNMIGNSPEAVAEFRKNMIASFDELMYGAKEEKTYGNVAFFERLYGQTLPNPVNTEESAEWMYNLRGTVSDNKYVSSVAQLKREDRSSGLSYFDTVYNITINGMYGDGVDCFC